MSKIFEDMGIFAIPESDETCILSSLLDAQPILFIGPPGTAKTEIMYMTALLFRESSKRKNPQDSSKWFNFNIYDTSKLNFEDLIGWPSPKALNEDRVDFIQSPTTIWDKDFIGLDELNRCASDRQANVLEVLRHRTCMGKPIRGKFIMSGINPFGDNGTNDMSEALADRHTFFIHFKPFDELDAEQQVKIMKRVGNFDSIGIRYWTGKKYQFDALKDYDEKGNVIINDYLADQGDRLIRIIENAASIYEDLYKQYHNSICSLICSVVSKIKGEKEGKVRDLNISGRRAGQMARAFIAYRAVDIARAKEINVKPQTIANSLTTVITSSLPYGIDKPATSDTVTRINKIVKDVIDFWSTSVLTDDDKHTNFSHDLYHTTNPIDKISMLLEHPNIDNLVVNTTWNQIVEKDPEVNVIICSFYDALGNTIPEHVVNEDRRTKAKNFVASSIKAVQEFNPTLKKWSEEILTLRNQYASKSAFLHTCAVLVINYLNRTVSNDNEALIGINSLRNFLSKTEKVIAVKKIESGQTKNENSAKDTEESASQTENSTNN